MRLAPQHLLSLSRLVLGAYVLVSLCHGENSPTILVAVVLACVADYFDGPVARRAGGGTTAGRLLDNCCDAGFLALAFSGFSAAQVWSTAIHAATPLEWGQLDRLPLAALAASFGTYIVRWLVASLQGTLPARSRRGHHAGIANYVLALVGAVAVLPVPGLSSYVVAGAFFCVTGLNVVAALDNVRLLTSRHSEA